MDEAYFSEATEETNPVAKQVYDKMIKPTPERALFEDVSKVMNFSSYCWIILFHALYLMTSAGGRNSTE